MVSGCVTSVTHFRGGIPVSENEVMPEVGSVKCCVKCGKLDLGSANGVKFARGYDHERNALLCRCPCDYTWYERCADGSEPNIRDTL